MGFRLPLGALSAWALALPLAAAAAPPVPQRVMSINLCADQLVLALLPPSRITSVTYLSRDPDESLLSSEAWRVSINHGTAEEVVSERPDLVIAGTYTTPATRELLAKVGIPLLALPSANDFQEIRDVTRRVGRAVGEEAKAESLIRQMNSTLAQLAATEPKRRITIVGWDGGGSVPGEGTLFNAIITAAGAINLGASPGVASTRFDTEQLLFVHPELLAFGDVTIATPAIRNSVLRQPLVRHLYRDRTIVYPELLYTCGLPQTADAAVQIRRKMLELLHSVPPS
ncbi:MAG: ABC transporter substrate-binding protein [Steroidobacteraceae bacterium]